jgi:hypothetical protein
VLSDAAKRWVAGAMGLGLLVRGVHFFAVASSTISRWQDFIEETDFFVTWRWATAIRLGDLVGRPPFHPDTQWMRQLGSPDDWARWWGGVETFQQAPLYAYLVAAVCRPPDGSPLTMFAVQCLGGVLCVPMVAFLASRWAGEDAGVAAAFLWALARAEVALDGFLLRDALALPMVLGLLCLVEALKTSPRWRSLCVAVGLVGAVAALQRENLLALAVAGVPLAAWARGAALRGVNGRQRAAAAGLALLGLAVGLGPLVARNAAVGAPPFALANRGPEAVLGGLSVAPGADPVGIVHAPAMRAQLEEARGSTLRAIGIVLREGAAQPGRFAGLLGWKLWAWLGAAEPTDNVNLNYLAQRSPVLRACVPTVWLVALALVGLVLCAREWRKSLLALVASVLLWGPLTFSLVLWRIRAGALPLLVPLAGIALAWAWRGRQEARGAVLGTLAGVVAFLGLAYAFPVEPVARIGPMGTTLTALVYATEGDPARALAALDEYDGWVARGLATERPDLRQLRSELLAGPDGGAP